MLHVIKVMRVLLENLEQSTRVLKNKARRPSSALLAISAYHRKQVDFQNRQELKILVGFSEKSVEWLVRLQFPLHGDFPLLSLQPRTRGRETRCQWPSRAFAASMRPFQPRTRIRGCRGGRGGREAVVQEGQPILLLPGIKTGALVFLLKAQQIYF